MNYLCNHRLSLDDSDSLTDDISAGYFSKKTKKGEEEWYIFVLVKPDFSNNPDKKLSKASVLVPYPFAAHNHQSLNAMFMENAGASVVINEEVLTEKYLTTKIEEILKEDRLPLMSEASRKLAKPDAAKEIVEQLYSLVGK